MKKYRIFILLPLLMVCAINIAAQEEKKIVSNTSLLQVQSDTLLKKGEEIADTASLPSPGVSRSAKKHSPRLATKRSAFIPGWGQAYNRQYWKIPIVYGILAIPVAMFLQNDDYYKKTKFAYQARYKELQGDSSDVPFIDPQLTRIPISNLQSYRNSFRRDRDYSVLWFFLAWGLQVADATVFAHLKEFTVSDDLSMQVKPTFNPYTKVPGLSLSFRLKNNALHRMAAR